MEQFQISQREKYAWKFSRVYFLVIQWIFLVTVILALARQYIALKTEAVAI